MKTMKNEALSRRAPVFCTVETDSTNAALRRMAAEGAEHGTILMADRQTRGRGRSGRSFLSPEGGLYLSVLQRFEKPDETILSLTAVTAVAVLRTLKRECGITPEIKWPNDLLFHGRKLCGILTEAVSIGDSIAVVVGIGVNLNTPEFPPELRDIACSILMETGMTVDRGQFTRSLIGELDACYEDLRESARGCLAEYRANCGTLGKKLAGGLTAVRIEEDYSLILRREDGTEEKKFFGEILQ